jgi:hypothetical protein
MKTFGAFVAGALFAVLAVTPVSAQQPGTATDPHHPAPPAGSSTTPPPAPPASVKPEAMPLMDMCRQMMGDIMSMPTMGGGASTDPKERAEMLEMRGEMMKAMGDIMMKHARRMQGTKK